MPTLQIDLEDNATAGLDEFNAALDQMADNAANAAKVSDSLTAAQQRNLIVIERQKTNAYDLGKTYISVFGDIATTGVRCFQAIEVETEKAASAMAMLVIKEGASLIRWGIGATTTIYGLSAAYGSHTKAVDTNRESLSENNDEQERSIRLHTTTKANLAAMGLALGSQTSAWERVGKASGFAGETAFKAVTGTGPFIAGASATLSAYEAVWARTGMRIVETADGSKKLENNLDRVNTELDRFVSTVGRDFQGLKDNLSEWWNTPMQWPDFIKDVGKEIDASTTRSVDILLQNMKIVRSAYKGVSSEQFEESAKIDAAQARNAESFRNLRRANDDVISNQQLAAEKQRIASISTIAGIDAEIRKFKEKSAEIARQGNFDEQDAKNHVAWMEAFGRRRDEIEKQSAQASAQYQRQRIQAYADERKALDALIDREVEVFRSRMELNQKLNAIKQDTINAANREAQNVNVAAAKDAHDDEKERIKQQLELRGATETQIKSQLAQMDRQFAQADHALKLKNIDDEARARIQQLQKERAEIDQTGGNRIERGLKKLKNEEELAKAIADYRKKQIAENGAFAKEWNKIEVADKRQAEAAKFAAEKERMDKVKALQEQAKEQLKAQFNARDFMNAQDPQKVFKQLQENRAQAAGQAAANDNADLWMKWQQGDKQAGRKYDKAVNAAQAKARRSAVNDFENGTLDQGEVSKAQGDVGQKTLSALQQQGKLEGDIANTLSDVLQTLAAEQQQRQQLQAFVGQLQAAARGQKNIAKQSMNTLQSTQGGLL